MEELILLSHVTSGGLVLILGLLNFINRKGSKTHLLLGKIYVAAMWWICLTALIIIAFYRFSFFLMVIAVLTFYISFVGVRVVNRKMPGSERWHDWFVSGITALFGVALIGYGISILISSGGIYTLGILSIVFGFFAFISGFKDILFFRRATTSDKQWWLRQHINAMGGSYIAAVTAFAVQNGEVLLPDPSLNWLLWILPATIGSPVLSLLNRRYGTRMATT